MTCNIMNMLTWSNKEMADLQPSLKKYFLIFNTHNFKLFPACHTE